jgi:pimeloyl-ACP methyl ester carboxylesterase
VAAFCADAGVRRDCVKVTRGLDGKVMDDATHRLASFGKPALLAWAPEDRLFPFEHAERLAAILPDVRLETVPDSLTWVMRDQPELIATLIGQFIASTPLDTAAQADAPRA